MAAGRFPGPYLNSTNADDPVMVRVPMDKSGIGANDAGLPKGGVNSDNMTLKHVGGTLGKAE
jgi:hypothetical protein